MPPRIFSPAAPDLQGRLALDAQAARHVVQVLRLGPGDEVIVFDGSGSEWPAQIEQAGRSGASLRAASPVQPRRESPLDLTLLQGLARGARMDMVIQKATELGVSALTVVSTSRSVVRLDEQRGTRRLEHWQRVAIGACEQCGRTRLPRLEGPLPLEQALERLAPGTLRLLLDPGGSPPAGTLGSHTLAAVVLIGPEGGLTSEERSLALAHGFTPLRLGPRILRTETAALTALTLLQFLAGDLGQTDRAGQQD
ncbi:MAG: 16S rRNA (uracil(1498)-N(3))-methyltransferase [Chromatiales bacterium]|nr:16S rRNA (uracil(1498)-N(3))-methyltransferase [Chromatiales bacterium]